MSRLGKLPVVLPEGVRAELKGRVLEVVGPLGALSVPIPAPLTLLENPTQIIVKRSSDSNTARALHGLTQRLITNAVIGVTAGYTRRLNIKGVGMRGTLEGQTLTLSLGFSHPVVFSPPSGITIAMEKNTVVVSGINKQQVGQVAAQIRSLRPVEPYKGKGIRYEGELVILKPGKAGKGIATKGV